MAIITSIGVFVYLVPVCLSLKFSTFYFNAFNGSYEQQMLSARCNLYCNGNVDDPCITKCQQHILSDSVLNDSNTFISRPRLLCQDLEIHKTNTSAKIVLIWEFVEVNKSTNASQTFIVESGKSRNSLVDWQVLGGTKDRAIEVHGLDVEASYQFRITPMIDGHMMFQPTTSNQISLSGVTGKLSLPSSVEVGNFKVSDAGVAVDLSWHFPSELPCSYDIFWFPMSGDGYFNQMSFNQPRDELPVTIPNLLPGMNYSVIIASVDPSRKRHLAGVTSLSHLKYKIQKVCENAVTSYFVTPCSYTKGFNPKLCGLGPVINLTAEWIVDTIEIAVKWSPPSLYPGADIELEYVLKIFVQVDDLDDRKLSFQDITKQIEAKVQIKNPDPFRKYVIEIYAVNDGAPGSIVTTELIVPRILYVIEEHELASPVWLLVFVVLMVIVGVLFIIWIGFKKNKIQSYFMKVDLSPQSSYNVPEHFLPYFVPITKIQLRETLGQGAFGVVHKGEICGPGKDKEVVAVKEFRSPLSDDAEAKAYHEIELMQLIGRHKHVVSLRGFSISFDRILLLIEYCPMGDLLSWLRKLPNELGVLSEYDDVDDSGIYLKHHSTIYYPRIDEFGRALDMFNLNKSFYNFERYWTLLISFMYQIADGMEYISSHKVVHCDLAARNILMSSNELVKIGDFGLARDVYESKNYMASKARRLPIKWMSMETLGSNVFTTWSDIWSFGVLLWEITTFGVHPYPCLQNEQILLALKKGFRLPKPRHCNEELYSIMMSCWNQKPIQRPTFTELKRKLGRILEQRQNYCQITI